MPILSGLKRVRYSTDISGAFVGPVDLGAVLGDSAGLTEDPQETENSKGNMLYTGTKKTLDFNLVDLTHYNDLKTAMKNNTPLAFELTFIDDSTEVVMSDVLVKVKKNYGFSVGKMNTCNVKASGFVV